MKKIIITIASIIIFLGLIGIATATPIYMKATAVLNSTSSDTNDFNGAILEVTYTIDSSLTPDYKVDSTSRSYSNFEAVNMSFNITNRPNFASDILGLTSTFRLNVANTSSTNSYDEINFGSSGTSGGISVGTMRYNFEPKNFISTSGPVPNLEFMVPIQDMPLAGFSEGNFVYNTTQFYTMNQISLRINPNAIPEPSTILLLSLGLLGFAGTSRRKNR